MYPEVKVLMPEVWKGGGISTILTTCAAGP